jgi:hypothetical protein
VTEESAQQQPSAPISAGRPLAMSKQEVDGLTAQHGPEKALETVQAAEFKAIKARAQRLLLAIQKRLENHAAAVRKHHQNEPREPDDWLARVGFGRWEFLNEKEEWDRKREQHTATRRRLTHRHDRVSPFRSEQPAYAGKLLAEARVERRHPELARDGKAAKAAREGAEKARQSRERQEKQGERRQDRGR